MNGEAIIGRKGGRPASHVNIAYSARLGLFLFMGKIAAYETRTLLLWTTKITTY